jgi:hypothetical protein
VVPLKEACSACHCEHAASGLPLSALAAVPRSLRDAHDEEVGWRST